MFAFALMAAITRLMSSSVNFLPLASATFLSPKIQDQAVLATFPVTNIQPTNINECWTVITQGARISYSDNDFVNILYPVL